MIQVNLLPWRESARKSKKLRFGVVSIFFIFIAILALIALHLYFRGFINDQQKLNDYLQLEINQEQTTMSALLVKQKDRLALEAQLHFIMALYDKNYQSVRFLNGLTTIMSDIVKITKLTKGGNLITLEGIAHSDEDITNFTQNIAKSPLFNQVVLTAISGDTTSAAKTFQVHFVQKG